MYYHKQWRHLLLKKDLEPFRDLPTDVKFNNTRFRDP